MKNNVAHIVRDALLDEAGRYSSKEDLFCRIREQIVKGTVKRSNFRISWTLLTSLKRKVSIAICMFVVCFILAFAASSQVRAFAMQAVSSIKTIFVIDVVDNKVKIVEKPVSEVSSYRMVGVTVYREPSYSDVYFDSVYHGKNEDLNSDEGLGKVLGFKISYPQTLGSSFKEPFKLREKAFGITLKKPIGYEAFTTLREEMMQAIEDDDAFNRLGKYEPFKEVIGFYKNGSQHAFFIEIAQAWSLSELEGLSGKLPAKPQKTKVGELDGLWLKYPYPIYPLKTINGSITADMSSKPEIVYSDSLYWEKDKITYSLHTGKDFKLSQKDALTIAKDFMESN